MFRIKQIILLSEIADKILRKHAVNVEELNQILFDRPRVLFVEKGNREGEDVYSAYGQTEAGRYLIVFFILKAGNQALILSAREMDPNERKRYGKKQNHQYFQSAQP